MTYQIEHALTSAQTIATFYVHEDSYAGNNYSACGPRVYTVENALFSVVLPANIVTDPAELRVQTNDP